MEEWGAVLGQMALIWGRILGCKGGRGKISEHGTHPRSLDSPHWSGCDPLEHGTYLWAPIALLTAATDELRRPDKYREPATHSTSGLITVYMYAYIYIYPSLDRAQQHLRIQGIYFTSSNFNT